MLSAFFMIYHKLGYFFLLIAYLARIMAYGTKREVFLLYSLGHLDQQKYTSDSVSNLSLSGGSASYYLQQQSTGYYLWFYLFLKATVLLWTFHLAFWLYKDYLTCFMMAVITSLVTLLYGVVLVTHHIHTVMAPIFIALYTKIANFSNRR